MVLKNAIQTMAWLDVRYYITLDQMKTLYTAKPWQFSVWQKM